MSTTARGLCFSYLGEFAIGHFPLSVVYILRIPFTPILVDKPDRPAGLCCCVFCACRAVTLLLRQLSACAIHLISPSATGTSMRCGTALGLQHSAKQAAVTMASSRCCWCMCVGLYVSCYVSLVAEWGGHQDVQVHAYATACPQLSLSAVCLIVRHCCKVLSGSLAPLSHVGMHPMKQCCKTTKYYQKENSPNSFHHILTPHA